MGRKEDTVTVTKGLCIPSVAGLAARGSTPLSSASYVGRAWCRAGLYILPPPGPIPGRSTSFKHGSIIAASCQGEF